MNLQKRLWTMVFLAIGVLSGPAEANPKVVLYHSFEKGITSPDYAAGNVIVTAEKDAELREGGVYGTAVRFDQDARNASVRIELGDALRADSGTIALWQILDLKDAFLQPEENLLTLMDTENKPIFKLTKSGIFYVYEGGKKVLFDCFDSMYWLKGNREHFAITWHAGGSGLVNPRGIVRVYWKSRPYASYVMDLTRQPAALVIGDASAGISVDELYAWNQALPARAIWELMRQRPLEIGKLEKMISERCVMEAGRPAAAREAAWGQLARQGILVEAEANPGDSKPLTNPVLMGTGEAVFKASGGDPGNSFCNAATASGRACAGPGDKPLTFKMKVLKEGEYALALRYCLQRRINTLWPQNSTGKTPWSENYARVKVELDGKPLGQDARERLYPTGVYYNHSGDVEMWAWHALAGGKRTRLVAGEHELTVRFEFGLDKPLYDALLVSPDAGPLPPHRRWVDKYRIPPAWWVKDRVTEEKGGNRFDTYTVTLRNRTEEPCSYEIVVGPDKLKHQTAKADVSRIELKPFEEKPFRVTFTMPAGSEGISEWVNIYLWNEDVSLQQQYMLWNMVPERGFAERRHTVLLPAPDPAMQMAFRKWLKTRDEKAITPELNKWIARRGTQIGNGWGAMMMMPAPMSGERLDAMDAWMKMDDKAIDEYMPDGPAYFYGYGTGWERVRREYNGGDNYGSGSPVLKRIEPEGDIDLVTSVTFEGPNWEDVQKAKTDPTIKPRLYSKTYVSGTDNDVIAALRWTRWQSLLPVGWLSYSAPCGNTPLGRKAGTGIAMMAEAYYLTGDPAYAAKAFQMLQMLARKYTFLAKHDCGRLCREDRDWDGGRITRRTQVGNLQILGLYVLDLTWNALRPHDRMLLEQNVVRWSIYDGMFGPLFENPAVYGCANMEDMPFIETEQVLGDVEVRENELPYFVTIFKDAVHPDGIHICKPGCYGGVAEYINWMRKLAAMGQDVNKGNPALRNAFLTQRHFIFSCGGMPWFGDGGFGEMASPQITSRPNFQRAYQQYHDPLLKVLPDFMDAVDTTYRQLEVIRSQAPWLPLGAAQKRLDAMGAFYAPGRFPMEEIWPNVAVAPHTGIAMLRNHAAKNPADWVEVIFDYGRAEGRCHGHPARLASITSFNGQITSSDFGDMFRGKPENALVCSTYGHNTVAADGCNQARAGGPIKLGDQRETGGDKLVQWIDADSNRLYPGIYMRRTLFVTDQGVIDFYLCRSDKEHTYDWMYHSFGELASELKTEPCVLPRETYVFRFLKNARSIKTGDPIQAVWKAAPATKPVVKASKSYLNENWYVRLWSLPEQETELVLCTGPMHKETVDDMEIDYAMLRRKCRSTVFATVQEPWRESTGPKIQSARQLGVTAEGRPVPPTDAYAMEVIGTSGKRMVFLVNYSGGMMAIGRVKTQANVACWEVAKDGTIVKPHYTPNAVFVAER